MSKNKTMSTAKIQTTTSQSLENGMKVIETMFGKTIRETSASGVRENFFDPYGRIFYDEVRPNTNTTARSHKWYGRDSQGDLIEEDIFTAKGSVYTASFHEYDVFGNRVKTKDENGNETRSGYDTEGRIVSIDGATYPVRYGYDAMGRRISMRTTRDNGVIWDETRWEYDHVTGLCIAKIYADGTRIEYTYTPDGLLLRTMDARGTWKENVYDANRQIVGVTYSDGSSIALTHDDFLHLEPSWGQTL